MTDEAVAPGEIGRRDPSVAPAEQADGSPPRGASDPKLAMIVTFGLSWLVGTLLMIQWPGWPSAVRVFGPISVTLCFPVIGLLLGWQNSKKRESFIDNCYFLGFLFNLTGILVAFLPATISGRTILSHDIVAIFGGALGTTVVGILARTLLEIGSTDLSEVLESRRVDINRYAEALVKHTMETAGKFETLSQELDAMVVHARDHLTKLVDVDRGLTEFLSRNQQRAAAFDRSLDEKHAHVGQAVDQLSVRIRELQTAMGDAMANAQSRVSGVAEDFRAAISNINSIGMDAGDLRKVTEQARRDLQITAGQMETLVRSTREAVVATRDAGEGVARLSGALERSIQTSVDEATAQFQDGSQATFQDLQERLARATLALEDIINTFVDGISKLERLDRQGP